MMKCPSCGGEMQYNTKEQKVMCQYCGSLFEVRELTEKYKKAKEEEEASNTFEGKAYKCTECGATLMNFDDTAITFCSYCGSQAILEDKMMKQNNPDVVIPFKKSKEECIEAYKKKLSKFLFAPEYMKEDTVVDKFRGIYMPYGIYDLSFQGNAFEKGSKYAYRRGDYQYYNDYTITANDVDISYEGVSFDLVSKFYDSFSTSIPFQIKDAIPFDVYYMAGYYADCLDVKVDTYSALAGQLVLPDVTSRLRKRREYAKYGCSTPTVRLKSTPKIGMFPVYFLAVRSRSNDSIHYAVVNGQTGEVAIEIPIDFGKYCLFSIILSLITFVVMNHSFTIKPNVALTFSLIASLICFFFSKNQLRRIEKKKRHADDKGFNSVNQEDDELYNKSAKNNGGKWLWILLAFIISLFITLVLSPIGMMMTELPFAKSHMFVVPAGMAVVFVSIFVFLAYGFMKHAEKEALKNKEKLIKKYGINAVEEMENKKSDEKKMRFRFLSKETLAIIISLIPLVLNLAEDAFYYFAIVTSLVLVVLSFRDLVKEHNILVSNKLPQLEKRGGDENV